MNDQQQQPDLDHPEPLRVDTLRVIAIGIGCWVLAFVVVLLVPSLHDGDRDWWPWVPATGAVLGSLGWLYIRRGRGNASAA